MRSTINTPPTQRLLSNITLAKCVRSASDSAHDATQTLNLSIITVLLHCVHVRNLRAQNYKQYLLRSHQIWLYGCRTRTHRVRDTTMATTYSREKNRQQQQQHKHHDTGTFLSRLRRNHNTMSLFTSVTPKPADTSNAVGDENVMVFMGIISVVEIHTHFISMYIVYENATMTDCRTMRTKTNHWVI